MECSDCEIRSRHLRFPEDNGVKIWTGSGACTGSFQIDLSDDFRDCYSIVHPPALGCAGQCEDKPKHTECINMACVEVDGHGPDQCSKDENCYYMACDYTQNACIKKEGSCSSADECSTWSDCTHSACNYQTMSCDIEYSKGTDECNTFSDCSQYHYECIEPYSCQAVPGPGDNQCIKPMDCGGNNTPEPPLV